MHRQHSPHAHGEVDNGENTALLSSEEDSRDWRQLDTTAVKPGRTTGTWWRFVRYGVLAVAILAGTAALTKAFFFGPVVPNHPNLLFHGSQLRSNGTHDFKRTVLMVSIDGLRADYLDRGLTPHLLAISKKGLRAKSMRPVFPTLTFPNHWALMTGLYAESHGIVANNFWDPITQTDFHYNHKESAWNPSWWFGEPIWETAERAGLITANLMWPGPPKTSTGASSTYYVPWKNKVPLDDKLEQILKWIDLPLEKRPQLILGYEPSLDQAGHAAGPASALVNATLEEVDTFSKNLHDSLEARNLTDIVDVVFVSDHGMTDTSHPELIYIDDILGKEGMAAIEHEDGWPSMGLRFASKSNVTKFLDALLATSARNPEKFEVYTRDRMPERYHFSRNERIAPIYVVPRIGYVLTTHAEGTNGMNKGSHGYDNDELAMHAMFIAHGPFSKVVKDLYQRNELLARSADGWHSTTDDTYIMHRFQNVEVYNLIAKLLGISEYASTNGTRGFWDKYL
ncbi:Phosphodiest-domain-containing protein [Amanita rubescens]|nr:Phosphodiest-domain-containing protein [Amanita rubescens]